MGNLLKEGKCRYNLRDCKDGFLFQAGEQQHMEMLASSPLDRRLEEVASLWANGGHPHLLVPQIVDSIRRRRSAHCTSGFSLRVELQRKTEKTQR